jgi:uncharacterized protein (DUF433 family)
VSVLVAIPVGPGISPELLDKAVRHALAQTAEVVVLAAGDGVKPALSFRHDRLVVGTFPTNMGAPATQQAMLWGSPFPWYAPHGADDFVEPTHVASLLALRSKAAGSSVIWYHQGAKQKLIRSSRTWIEFGVFDTDLLRSIGGYGGHEPCGQDSVLISILLKAGGVRLTTRPTYHKVYRADSLTRHPLTRGGSPIRTGVRVRNREVLNECQRLGWKPEPIRAYREGLLTPEIRAELEDRVALVARWLT